MLPPALFRSDAATNPRLLDQLMAPANTILTDFIRGVYRDGALDDFKFTQLGVQRTLGQDKVTGSKFTFVRSARVEWVRFPLGCLHPIAGGLA